MLVVKDFLNGNNIGLKEIVVVRARTEQNNPDIICQVGAALTAYAGPCPTPAMMVMMTCSFMVNGPGLSGIPKKEIFGRKRAQALQIGRLNSMGESLSRRIRFSNWDPCWDPKRETETPWGIFFTNLDDGDGGVSEIEELVHAGNEDSPNKTDDPSTEGRRRHRGIICVGNRRTDFGIW
jgi:hypothetical protein